MKIFFQFSLTVFILLFLTSAAHAQKAYSTGNERQQLSNSLDSLASAALDEKAVAGFSVAVVQGSDTLLMKGYGHADVGLAVAATEQTKYRLIGPTTTILAALLMQQVERGNITLDKDITHLLPDFPWQGRSMTLRQLMDATSGLPDFHYLGDPFQAEIAIPKSQDEVTALFAGLPFTHEPGERQQWTISGFHLSGIILERITDRSFKELVEEEIIKPLGLDNTTYCNDRQITSNLATAYATAGDSLILMNPESPTIFPFVASVCASPGDVATFYNALRNGRVIKPETYNLMTEFSEAARTSFEQNGYGMVMGYSKDSLKKHRRISGFGALLGYNSSAQYYPDDSLEVVVLANTKGQLANNIASQLSILSLDLPTSASESIEEPPVLRNLPVTANDLERYPGVYQLTIVDAPPSYKNWQINLRVFNENGRLMIQQKGEPAEGLLKQAEHTFASATQPQRQLVFTIEDGKATAVAYETNGVVIKGGKADN